MDMRVKTADRAYSTIVVKAVDEDTREIRGVASTPSTDRMGDIVDPNGAMFSLPMPFLWQHQHDAPIGSVIRAKVTDAGLEIVAKLVAPTADMPTQMAARLQEAWASIKSALVRGLSIGFRPIEYSFLDEGGVRFLKYEIFEISAVTIPANSEASITTVKSFDQRLLAASGITQDGVVRLGKPTPGVSGKSVSLKTIDAQEGHMNLADQIKQFQTKRDELATAQETLISKSAADGRTLDGEEALKYDSMDDEIKSVDEHIARLQKMEQGKVATAKRIDGDAGQTEKGAAAVRGQAPAVVRTTKNEEPGLGLAKFAMAMYAGQGNVTSAKAFAEHAFANDARLQNIMKAAVAAGTTTSATWAGNLVDYQNLSNEFAEYLRPRTIVGQFGAGNVPSLRMVPFNVRIPGKTSAGTAGWVGEGFRKPVTASGYAATELKWAKIAAISVITEELERFSDPSIQRLVRDDLAEAVIERMDIDFVDPNKAAGTGATQSPASITNGVTAIVSTGDPEADMNALWAVADAANLPVGSAVYITNTATVRALTSRKNPLGNREYPELTMTGGTIDGVPVVVSNYVPAGLLILAFASEIYLADDGMVNIDVSREATIFMDSDPNNATPTAAQLVSMFQTNQLAIRAERYVNWQKRRPQAVAYVSGIDYGTAQS